MITLLYSVIFLGILGLLFGTFLAFAAKKFEVKEDVKVLLSNSVLPGVNCGACGFPGCEAYAKAYIKGEADVNACLPGKRQGIPEKLKKINAIKDEELSKLFEENDSNLDKINKVLFEE